MSRNAFKRCGMFRVAVCSIVFTGLLQAIPTHAAQIDIPGPTGSGAFGTAVAVLPDGNIVVTDPNAASSKGAVYLYSPTGVLVNFFTGGTANDQVGSGGITVLQNGNFVISSPNWANGTATVAGAVTWVNGSTGLSGAVSATNSLVGTRAGDKVGFSVTALSNGNYVVASLYWANGAAGQAGAVTWANGNSGLSGAISAANSLVGTQPGDEVGGGYSYPYPIGGIGGVQIRYFGGVTALSNGNYVVASPDWANATITTAGATTWADGTSGLSGAVSTTNSLVGTTAGDQVGIGTVTALRNGNYVVASPTWTNAAVMGAGAVTWANGSKGLSGVVSVANSLVGIMPGDSVGIVTALSNGNYVVASPNWANGAAAQAGAATWADGSKGLSGAVSALNSLVGTTAGDGVDSVQVTALSNGNYVVANYNWSNGTIMGAGAATWANGGTGLSGPVSATNSLVGTTATDAIGIGRVTALSNGNYVVGSPNWGSYVGAATWANGSTGLSGAVSATNSLVGTTSSDGVGSRVTALSNGNYVVASDTWTNGAAQYAGAATWANGSTGLSGTVSAINSLVGTTPYDNVGLGVTALSNGNYVVDSFGWNNGTITGVGAATWANGSTGLSGVVSPTNSLVGTQSGDEVGSGGGVTALSNGNYVVDSPNWANGAIAAAGAVSLGRGSGGLVGSIVATNSVRGTAANGGFGMVFAYDAVRDQLVVGQPASNIVSLFTNQTAPSITIDGYMSGNWFNPEQSGHGFQIEATNAIDSASGKPIMVAIWFVYTPDGSGQNWIYAQGTYDKTSNTVTLPAILDTGAKFPPNFKSSDLTQTAWGNLTFSFTDCNNGTATWSSPLPGYGMGSLPITRLTQIAGTTCPP